MKIKRSKNKIELAQEIKKKIDAIEEELESIHAEKSELESTRMRLLEQVVIEEKMLAGTIWKPNVDVTARCDEDRLTLICVSDKNKLDKIAELLQHQYHWNVKLEYYNGLYVELREDDSEWRLIFPVRFDRMEMTQAIKQLDIKLDLSEFDNIIKNTDAIIGKIKRIKAVFGVK